MENLDFMTILSHPMMVVGLLLLLLVKNNIKQSHKKDSALEGVITTLLNKSNGNTDMKEWNIRIEKHIDIIEKDLTRLSNDIAEIKPVLNLVSKRVLNGDDKE